MTKTRHIERQSLMSSRRLTPEGEKLAEEIYIRALALMAVSGGELSAAEAVDIAAAQIVGIPGRPSDPETSGASR